MKYKTRAKKIISGGQTGIDRGALDACLDLKFPAGGWCPKNRRAEDGEIHEKYPLRETHSEKYDERTRLNVKDADDTLIIARQPLAGGTLLTLQVARELSKPFLVVHPESSENGDVINTILEWLNNNTISVLNIAGPRQSEWQQAHETSYRITANLIHKIWR